MCCPFFMCLLILQIFTEYQHLQGPVGEHKDAEALVLPKNLQLGSIGMFVSNCTAQQYMCLKW